MHAESDHQMIPADLVIESTSRLLASTSTAALLRLKADTHFTVPQRVEGWVDLHAERDGTSTSAKSVF